MPLTDRNPTLLIMLSDGNTSRVASFGGLEIRSAIFAQQDDSKATHIESLRQKENFYASRSKNRKARTSKTAAVVGSHAGSRAAGLAPS